MQTERRIRKGDPDVYLSADSARVRSRQMGCIGIRKYSTVDGGEAWMPCTNESDYRRSMGIGPQAKRDREKRERTLVQRVINNSRPKINASEITTKTVANKISSISDNRFIVSKVRNHNKEMELAGRGDSFKATVGMLEKIWNKEIRNGSKEAMRRINIFLSVLSGARPNNLKYISDLSMLPEGHPRKSSVNIKRYTVL